MILSVLIGKNFKKFDNLKSEEYNNKKSEIYNSLKRRV